LLWDYFFSYFVKTPLRRLTKENFCCRLCAFAALQQRSPYLSHFHGEGKYDP